MTQIIPTPYNFWNNKSPWYNLFQTLFRDTYGLWDRQKQHMGRTGILAGTHKLFSLFLFHLLLIAISRIYSPLHIWNEISLAEITVRVWKSLSSIGQTLKNVLEGKGEERECLQKLNVSISRSLSYLTHPFSIL